jgi:hypothetical protein
VGGTFTRLLASALTSSLRALIRPNVSVPIMNIAFFIRQREQKARGKGVVEFIEFGQ